MEHADPIGRDFSWRETAPALALLIPIALIGLGAWTLLHPTGAPATVHAGPLRPRSATPVLVLNGNGIAGAAGDISNRLLAHGYRSAPATDARVTTYARSVVLFRLGWENEAQRLAKDARIRAVAPLDGSLPRWYRDARLVVILGH